MDKFAENLTGGLRRFAMAGVGAVSVTIDKSKEIFEQLAEKGEAAAADSQIACDELQHKLAEQLDAFARRLKADYENAGFEQLLAKCMKLTPEQKTILIEKLTAELDAEEEQTEVSEREPGEPAAETASEPAECEDDCTDESAAEIISEPAECADGHAAQSDAEPVSEPSDAE